MKSIIIHRRLDDVIDGLKTAEYRAYATDHRGPILLCAPETRTHHCRAVCVADLVECQPAGSVFAWSYAMPREILPVGVAPMSGLFDVSIELDELILLDDLGDGWQGPVEEALERLKKTKKNRETKNG